jgi:hypothetical protein
VLRAKGGQDAVIARNIEIGEGDVAIPVVIAN